MGDAQKNNASLVDAQSGPDTRLDPRADAAAGFLAASLAYPDGIDEYEFYFKNDGSKTVLFKAQSRVNRASPPGCFTPGCINGPRNRARVEELQREIGWLGFETDEDKKWVPLLLH